MRRIGSLVLVAIVAAAWPAPAAGRSVDGCPVRDGHRVVARQGGVVVTVARRSGADLQHVVWRACHAGSRRDRVLLRSTQPIFAGAWTSHRLVAAGQGVVAFVEEQWSRYDGCERNRVFTLSVDTAAPLRSGPGDWCGLRAPPAKARAVVTGAGAVVWLHRHGVYALTAAGAVDRLDYGPIRGLRTDGAVVRWRNGGAWRGTRP